MLHVGALGSLTIPSLLPTARRCSESFVEYLQLGEPQTSSTTQPQHGGVSILYSAHPAELSSAPPTSVENHRETHRAKSDIVLVSKDLCIQPDSMLLSDIILYSL